MAEKQEEKSSRADKQMSKYRRQMLREVLHAAVKQDDVQFRRYVEEPDPFMAIYGEHRLLQPKYSFSTLYRIYEESDILQECVDAMIQNVDGFGYELSFLGDDLTQKTSPEAVAEKEKAEAFFDQVNHDQSFTAVRKLFRADFEVCGCGAFEVLRNRLGEVQMIYHMPMTQLRMAAYEGRKVTANVTLQRNGKPVTVQMKRYFRKFAQLRREGATVTYFKQYGDPRFIDATDGLVKGTAGACKVVASEILFIRNDFANLAYGLPRWIGAVLDVLGRRSAQYVNWDLFESQGIPPFAVMVSGGVLTDESLEDLEALIRGLRGAEQWNKALILESTIETVGMEDRGTAKIELKNLTDYRKEDLMFDKYLDRTSNSVRRKWRLPPLYVGGAEEYTHATARAAQSVAEEQVFVPERKDFDEVVDMHLMQKELGITMWGYKTSGPRIVGAEEISRAVNVFTRSGAITVNHAIHLANRAFGLTMSEFEQVWADYPITLVVKLMELGRLKGVEAIDVGPAPPALPAPPQQKQLPYLPAKVFKSDMFSEEEQNLYKRLLALQHAVEIATARGLDDEAHLDKKEEAEAEAS
jgi:PBSX family phage portal protein